MSWPPSRAPQEPRQVAVVDLGSNSWRLVVFSITGGAWWKRTDELYETVRIGEGIDASGRLGEPAIARGLETLEVFSRFCAAHALGREDVHAIATSAIRDAVNREDFLRRAHERSGLDIEVLSAEEEARLGYVAAVNSTTLTDGAVLDLGGGSLQLVAVAGRRAGATASFRLGAVRLTERFLPGSGPAKRKALDRLRAHVRSRLEELGWLRRCGPGLVVLGGAARNLAAVASRVASEPDLGVQGYRLTPKTMRGLVDELAGMSVAERGRLPGIKPGRADIVLAAAATLQTVLEYGGFEAMEVTEAGLREGKFIADTLLAGQEPLLEDVRVAAVRNLAFHYEADLRHTEHVATLSLQFHDSLVQAGLIRPQPDERELLWTAAMLHDVGMTISYDDHHKHSQYLIATAELPGFDPRERALVALMSRYHRKGSPKLGELAALARKGDEEMLERCAVILRLAEHLERGRDQSVRAVRLAAGRDGVDLHLHADGDLTLPRWSLERYGDGEAFQRVFGHRLVFD